MEMDCLPACKSAWEQDGKLRTYLIIIMSYSTVVLYIWDHRGLGFLPNNVTQKPALHFLSNRLAVLALVRPKMSSD